ncbi:MAG: T9SS type A sorting domain-containing protein [Bacteroidia bacterium]
MCWYTGAGVECPIPATTAVFSGTTYYATQTVGNCESSTYLAVTPTICTTPTVFTVTGGGAYCAGGAGVSIGLSNTQSGINYQVKDGGGNNVGASIPGSGTPAGFGNITTPGTYTVEATNTSGGGCTATMAGNATVTVNQPTASSFSTTACDSYSWQGTNYTTTGTYTATITNAAGCDSVMTLNLTINNSTTSTATVTACNNYAWQGANYTATGTYSDTITNAAGCDSIMVLNLTINNITTSTATVTACNNYAWQGANYTATGTYSDTITNAAGCDSIMVLNLTINNITTSTATVTACNNYAWQGANYTATGTYSDTITNAAGCDSIMVLNLTITNLDVTTTVSNTTVTANQANAMYQWIDCTNADSAIVGETNISFTAINNGSYAVIVSVGNCVDTSACVNILTVGKNKLSAQVLTTVYPNPSTGSITLTSNATTTQTISIINNIGQTVYTGIMSATQEVDMGSFASGIYTIQITSPTHLQHIKLIKQ